MDFKVEMWLTVIRSFFCHRAAKLINTQPIATKCVSFFRAVAVLVVRIGRTHATVNSTSNKYIKSHVAPCVSEEFADWYYVSVWIPSDFSMGYYKISNIGFFSVADITIACDGSRGWRLGYIVPLFGQTWSMQMPSSTSFISCSQIDNQNQSADQWYWIASSAGVLWKVSKEDLSKGEYTFNREIDIKPILNNMIVSWIV